MTILSLDDENLVRQLREARKHKNEWAKVEEDLKARVMQMLGDDDRGLTAAGVPACHVKTSSRRVVNADKLEALYPDVYEAVVEERETVRLNIDLSD